MSPPDEHNVRVGPGREYIVVDEPLVLRPHTRLLGAHPAPQTLIVEHRLGVKCCPGHPWPANRAMRRAADRTCSCRGVCGYHGTAARGVSRDV